ncbi:MAG: DUF3859 domain-containing protein [Gammaproteobacteria bacterium]|nr:DUF3859 domain-containing protein [Gammaproteobacteria bacterium]
MAKPKPIIEIVSYGIYDKWNLEDKSLPKIQVFTNEVEAEIDVEFGFVINIKRAKGEKVRYCIYHPDIPDENGEVMPPFDGEEYIKSNNWDFYLGDTIWAPVHNKLGLWRMTIELQGKVIAEKKFNLIEPEPVSSRFAHFQIR